MISVSGVHAVRLEGPLRGRDRLFSPGGVTGSRGPTVQASPRSKLLTGEQPPQRGSVTRPPKLGVLRQDNAFDTFRVIDTVIMGNQRLWNALQERDVLYTRVDMSNEDGMRSGSSRASSARKTDTRRKTRRSCCRGSTSRTRCTEDDGGAAGRTEGASSSGASALRPSGSVAARRADEPPGPGLDPWLEEFLNRYDGTLIVISHDRHFLNNVCTHTDIDYETIITYTGGYDDMVLAKTQARTTIEAQNEQREKKIAQLNDFIARFSAGTRSSQVQSRRKEVERLRRRIWHGPTSSAPASSSRPSGRPARCRSSSRRLKAFGERKVISSSTLSSTVAIGSCSSDATASARRRC